MTVASFKFKHDGFKDLRKGLKRVGDDAPKIIRAGMRAGAVVVKKRAQANLAGVRDTGLLSDSIRVSTRISRNRSVVAKVGNTKRTFYGTFLEFGTLHQHPLRWLTRALTDNPEQTFRAVGDRIRRRLKKWKPKKPKT